MNRRCAVSAAVTLAIFGLLSQASAAPPTVTPSPGYDARLQEQRNAASSQPAASVPAPVVKHHVRQIHHPKH